ncbi:protein of unknown function [Alkalispirochaeta americana]|uniref:TM7S3/TM198-like domain-containing protein n=1 Tax=Alkalispirochaeta americana TaxID=159291 RepID=A0A1N6SJD0_9SPIO|nr:DUF4203 domain-containing protein [Alkalispirochaeta americana]SIQ41180.1 protein of unknown function [Alkalispirochaeta americana]
MNVSQEMMSALVGASILIGAVQCFLGYRIFKVVLAVTGFLAGGLVAGSITFAITEVETTALLAGAVGGVAGAAVMLGLYVLGVFFIGALLGAVLGVSFSALGGFAPEPVVLLVLAAATGIAAVVLQRIMIILSTSFAGSWSVVIGTAYFVTGRVNPADMGALLRIDQGLLYVLLGCWVALGVAGVVVQLKTTTARSRQRTWRS